MRDTDYLNHYPRPVFKNTPYTELLGEKTDFSPGIGKYKMSPAHTVLPESKEMLKE